MAVLTVVIAVVVGLISFSTALLRWNEVRYRKRGLPPGTMGWPVVGETTEFLKQGPDFMTNRRARYGSLFKTHILGSPIVVSMDGDTNRYILMNEWRGLIPGYPESMLHTLGKYNMASVHGSTHKYMRGALVSLITPTMLRYHILPKVDRLLRSYLSNWHGLLIDIQHKTKEMAFLLSMKQIAGIESGPIVQQFKSEFFKLVLGTLSLPIDLPGTNCRKAVEARKKILNILESLIAERRASKETGDDMLGCLLKEEENKHKLSDEEVMDQIITLVYSGYETVSTTSMMAVKYLHDHPHVLHELTKEHLAIRQNKKPDESLTWEDFKSMRLTRAVIFEASRLATVVNGVFRKTTKEMEINGFVIPKGWRIYVYIREDNYDPYLYPDPHSFNPWRWMEKNLESLIFGAGTRMCPGKELGVLEISTFLHYFVTRYTWKEEKGNKLVKFPRVRAPNGLHVHISSRTSK